MAKILFINANLYGHINPTLPLVKEMADRGNQLDYFCSLQFKEKVMETGAAFLNYSEELDEFLKSYRPTDRHPFYMLMEYILLYAEVMLPGVLKLIEKNPYDMIIGDSLFGGPFFLEQIIKIPVVSSHSSFAMSQAPVPASMMVKGIHPQLDHCYEILERICRKYEIPVPGLDDVFISKANWNVVYTIPEFNGSALSDSSDYLFTGSALGKEIDTEFEGFKDKNGRPVIYISLGSVNTDFMEFYKMCMKTFENSDYFVVMSIGNKCNIDQLGKIPSNFYVKNFLPQSTVLKQTDVFITHAGFNSVNEALYYGIPLYTLPMVNDQHMVAKRVKDMGLGIIGNFKEINTINLRDGVMKLLSDKQIQENCENISLKFREFNHLSNVAATLEKISKGQQ
ncbi:macrolide family glycosyltransferase [Anaerocolumna sp. MB42-C2]|uniref:macrolide family glycosyltransferase n=1 Tax=Anaerocolumna sp. MB42-C2 TaxID=3070997 RepID=UPI0027E20966|nr:macrolide family glycosyltransferase [Anaerocolumna sp. MB42-C2]WMJ89111.1 glycosyltransferase [Anaerocolumna sp. MB42-C2]